MTECVCYLLFRYSKVYLYTIGWKGEMKLVNWYDNYISYRDTALWSDSPGP